MHKRACALDDCTNVFETDNSRKKYCSREHMNLDQQRRWRDRHRKRGGGGDGGGGGGGESPTLFDTITPIDERANFIPVIGPGESERKPSVSVTKQAQALKAAA